VYGRGDWTTLHHKNENAGDCPHGNGTFSLTTQGEKKTCANGQKKLLTEMAKKPSQWRQPVPRHGRCAPRGRRKANLKKKTQGDSQEKEVERHHATLFRSGKKSPRTQPTIRKGKGKK